MNNRNEFLRELLDEFPRADLIAAAEMANEGVDENAIAGDLLIPGDRLQDCVEAGKVLILFREDQRKFEASLEG